MISRILEEVDKLTKKYKTRDPFEIAKGLNIDIIYHDLGNLKGSLVLYFFVSLSTSSSILLIII